jgi:hypothetical protein
VENLNPVVRVAHLRVKLQAVDFAFGVGHRGARAAVGRRHARKALGQAVHIVGVAHPADKLFVKAREQGTGGVEPGLRAAVFALVGACHMPAEQVCNQLVAVADAENWDAQRENLRVYRRRVRQVHAARAAGKDDADGLHCGDFHRRNGVRFYFAIHAAFAHAPGDEVVVLPAEINDQDQLMFHFAILLAFFGRID